MKKSKIALKPYLDSIFGYCDTLSNEELTKIIIGLAKDVSTSGRVAFLEKLESLITDGKKVMALDTESVDQILDAIEALKESIQERIRSIEDGSYWDESVGWSYDSNAGVVFGSVLSVLAGHSGKAGTIKSLLKGYANKSSAFSGRISIEGGRGTSFYEEIIKGLKHKEETKSKASEYLSWAEKIGKGRIDHIVSNKHRNAYGRAAHVLGSLAETYASMGQKSKSIKILHKYYNEKYNRFSAFRREVKAVVMGSGLLRNSGFLT